MYPWHLQMYFSLDALWPCLTLRVGVRVASLAQGWGIQLERCLVNIIILFWWWRIIQQERNKLCRSRDKFSLMRNWIEVMLWLSSRKTLCFGKNLRKKARERERRGSWRSTLETCCDCSYNACLTGSGMQGDELSELHCASSHSTQCRWSCLVRIISVISDGKRKQSPRTGARFQSISILVQRCQTWNQVFASALGTFAEKKKKGKKNSITWQAGTWNGEGFLLAILVGTLAEWDVLMWEMNPKPVHAVHGSYLRFTDVSWMVWSDYTCHLYCTDRGN